MLGTTALLEGPAAGTDSDMVLTSGPWSASSNATWLNTSATGTGNGLATFTFDANPGATRSGTLTIAGLTLTVTQAGSTYVPANSPTTLVSSGAGRQRGVTVDGSGNVFFSDTDNGAIKEWHASTQTVSTLVSSGLNLPFGVAVDGSGNVFIADTDNGAIKEWNAATGTVTTLVASGLNGPQGVAVDGSGNVFIADTFNNALEEWHASTQTVSTLVSSERGRPAGVAVDGSGNVFFSDIFSNALEEWHASTQTVSTLVASGLNGPAGVAVDGSGNVFIADTYNHALKEWNGSTGTLSTLVSSGLSYPGSVAVDGSGNVFIADTVNRAIKELPRAFVPGGAVSEGVAAGADALPPVLPATQALSGPFAPSSDQSWLTVDSVANGVVHFSFTQNSGPTRTAHLTVLGQQIPVTQAAAPAAGITVTGYGVPYDGQPHTATGTATGAGGVDLGADLSLGGTRHTAAGSWTDTWTFHDPTGTYQDASGTVTDTITPATLTITPATGQSKVYGAAVPTLTYTASGLVNNDPASTIAGALATTATAASPVGSYAITLGSLSAGSNYTVALAANSPTFAVTPATLLVSANNATRSYAAANPTSTAGYSGFVNGDTAGVLSGSPSLTTTATAGSPPGIYAITAGPGTLAAANYQFTFVNGTLTVTAAPLSATGVNLSVTAGAPFSGTVATFTTPDQIDGAAAFTATITWGDGSTSNGLIAGSNGSFTVSGSHTYADPASESVRVSISHNLGYTTTATASGTATVTGLGQGVQSGQAGGIGFWQNNNGQALINSFNGSPTATALSAWLAAAFPNLYGAGAGGNNLSGKSNAQVAAFYLTQFDLQGPKVEAQVLAAALNVYATTASLGGSAGTAYGFTVSATGLGAQSFNVGSDGAAVGVANNSTLNVYELLLAVNKEAVNGVPYNGDATLRAQCADLFDSLNQAGSIG
jgi:sugar lactone lactonase YvrE